MKQYLNASVFYILLWSLYYLQGTLYAEGSIISQLILAILLVYSFFCFCKVVISYKMPVLLKSLSFFLVIMTIYGVYFMLSPHQIYDENNLSSAVSKTLYLKNLYVSILPIYVMYYFAKKDLLSEEVVKIIFIILLITYIILFQRVEQTEKLKLLANDLNDDNVVNNMSYHFLKLFPLLFFWNSKPILQFLIATILLFFVLSGFKRGAIVISVVCFMWFFYKIFKDIRGRQRFYIVLLTILFMVIGGTYVYMLYDSNQFFQYRMEQTIQGDYSARDVIYLTLWNNFQQELSLLKVLFGNGVYHTISLTGTFAHNDWLELLTNQGLIGVLAYLLFFVYFVRTIYLNRRNNLFVAVMGMCFIIIFISSFYSMSYEMIGLAPALGIGYCMCQISNKKI